MYSVPKVHRNAKNAKRDTNCNKTDARNATIRIASTVLTTTQGADFAKMASGWQQLLARNVKTQIAGDAIRGILLATNARQALS